MVYQITDRASMDIDFFNRGRFYWNLIFKGWVGLHVLFYWAVSNRKISRVDIRFIEKPKIIK
jgi:hypothetical protein